ncbi:MAG: hypothetical protein KBC95_03290 [Candidatus Peribacteraceae bacterium]|nr:hypothetical protein [Candidatus Peribacteraceae bacterium]
MQNNNYKPLGAVLAIGVIAAALLAGCTPYNGPDAQTQVSAETYIRSNIATLSPRSATTGSRFAVTDIEWEDENTALVTYKDGNITLSGRTDISASGSTVTATRLRLANDTSSSSMSSMSSMSSSMSATTSSSSSRTSSSSGTTTSSSSSVTSSSSTTSPSSSSSSTTSSTMGMAPRGEGEFCGGIAAFPCQDGLRCQLEGSYPDAGGTCVRA